MNNMERNDQLEREIHMGEKAAKAYSLWVMPYIQEQSAQLFDEFKNAPVEEYPLIHARINALTAIDYAIKQDIQTGDLARKQLGKGE
jgi:hypothetical protein